MAEHQGGIESSLQENRVFHPSREFAGRAHIHSRAEYDRLYRESIDHPDAFWDRAAGELHWFKPWDKVLEWKPPYAKWFVGGKTNVAYNCLDHQIELAAATRRRSSGRASPRAAGPAAAGRSTASPTGSSATTSAASPTASSRSA